MVEYETSKINNIYTVKQEKEYIRFGNNNVQLQIAEQILMSGTGREVSRQLVTPLKFANYHLESV